MRHIRHENIKSPRFLSAWLDSSSRRRSKNFHSFIEATLTKDHTKRPNTEQLLKHPFVRDQPNEKQVLREIREHIDKHNRTKRGFECLLRTSTKLKLMPVLVTKIQETIAKNDVELLLLCCYYCCEVCLYFCQSFSWQNDLFAYLDGFLCPQYLTSTFFWFF